MVFNTLTVGAAITPSIVETYFSHYLNRSSLRQKPTAHISYHEGLRLIREFLDYSSKHTVEDLQAFTSQWVPAPHWVRINDAEIAPKFVERAASLLCEHLGRNGLEKIGGRTWWQWRRPESPLRAEWIEMKKEYQERKQTGARCERCILYVHGGAYYFGSVDEHRYQMQRHARKLKARVLAPRYRLAPQFPFPCGLLDCLSSYFYLLDHFSPNEILFAGDSAGGGMVLSMLVILRDQGQPLPAGTILLSPWVDLTHSFPSVAGDGVGDYIPPHGFHHKPSAGWPPPPSDAIKQFAGNATVSANAVELPGTAGLDMKKNNRTQSEKEEEDIRHTPKFGNPDSITALPSVDNNLNIMLDGKLIEMREQVQLYTINELLAHPLVSPVMQPSLGGLPPMLIQVGGAELLKDEQIYLAHKAADPKAYPPNDTILKEYDPQMRMLDKFPPTDVQLQVWDDLCHVAPTLSFTRPAKYMYRSIAQFGAWALAHAQQKGIDIQNDDAISVISSGEEDEGKADKVTGGSQSDKAMSSTELGKVKSEVDSTAVGKAGDPLPPFKDHMIRQRVTRHGIIHALAPSSEIAALALDPASIGVIKPGPVRKWLAARSANDLRFGKEKNTIQKKRAKELSSGYDLIPGEKPPPTALVNRRRKGVATEEKKKKGKSWGLAMWSGWGSSHDEQTLQREEDTEKEAGRKSSVTSESDGHLTVPDSTPSKKKERRRSSVSAVSSHLGWLRETKSKTRSPYEQVNDTGQAGKTSSRRNAANSSPALATSTRSVISRGTSDDVSVIDSGLPSRSVDRPVPIESKQSRGEDAPIPTTGMISPDSEKISGTDNAYLSPASSRPHNGVQAYPFKLLQQRGSNPSIATLDSTVPDVTSTPHSELAGDAPKPAELPSAVENGEPLEAAVTAAIPAIATVVATANVSDTASSKHSTRSTPSSPEPQATSMSTTPQVEKIVSPIEDSSTKINDAPISPVEGKKVPFKLRNKVFDQRTSMLGSIGADGMPNAHYAFTRDDSPRRDTTTPPEPGVPTEAVKAAPFKLRHTVYDPASTFPKPAEEYIAVQNGTPEAVLPLEHRSTTVVAQRRQVRESGTLGDLPPSYETMPVMNITMPETVPRRPVVKPREDQADERPPPPPPKDEKHVNNRRVTGIRKVGSGANMNVKYINGNAKTTSTVINGNSKSSATTETSSEVPSQSGELLRDLSFEDRENKRPPLETFVTASESRDLKGS